MNKKTYTLAELVERSEPYFASNPTVPYLLATTHKGKFYLPEFESYAQHAVDKAREGEVLVIDRELLLKPVGMSYADAFAEAGLVVPVATPAAPSALAEAVASATHFTFPEPAAPAAEPAVTKVVVGNTVLDAKAAEVPAKRTYKPRAPKPAAELATESAPAAPKVRKPRAAKPDATATATKTKATTKKTK